MQKYLKTIMMLGRALPNIVLVFLFFYAGSSYAETVVAEPIAEMVETDAKPAHVSSKSLPEQSLLGQADFYLTKKGIDLIPAGNSIASVLETFYAGALNQNIDTAGFAMGQWQYTSILGHSQNWQNFFLNGVDLRSNLNSSTAVIDVPIKLTQVLADHFLPTHNHQKRGIYSSLVDGSHTNFISLGYTKTIFGPAFMPANTFDREPAENWGAIDYRRNFAPSFELSGKSSFRVGEGGEKKAMIAYDFNAMQQNFRYVADTFYSGRHSLFYTQELTNPQQQKNTNQQLLVAVQNTTNQKAFIENFSNEELSRQLMRNALLIHLKQEFLRSKIQSDTALHIANLRIDPPNSASENNSANYYVNYEELQFSLAPQLKQNSYEVSLQNKLYKEKILPHLDFSNQLRLQHTQKNYLASGTKNIYYFLNQPMKVENFPQGLSRNSTHLSMISDFQGSFEAVSLQFAYNGGISTDLFASNKSSFDDGGSYDYRLGFNAAISALKKFQGGSQFKFGFSHEAMPISANVLDFVLTPQPYNQSYFWNDYNANGVFDAGEQGALLSQSGASTQHYAKDLRHPSMVEAYFKYATEIFRHWNYSAMFNLRYYYNLYGVRLSNGNANSFTPVEYAFEQETFTVYNKDSALMGSERYELGNNAQNALTLSITMQLFDYKSADGYLLNFSAAVNNFLAAPPMGNSMLYNDIGEFHISQADKNLNNELNYGRTTADRAYILKFIFGRQFGNFSWVNTLHYRDGEVMARMIPVYGLNQGSELIFGQARGGLYYGTPRYTYYMQWDIRLNYEYQLADKKLKFSLDFYNFLDSRTEINEFLVAGPFFREPQEVVIPRTLRFLLTVEF